jgi:hypothetical protein
MSPPGLPIMLLMASLLSTHPGMAQDTPAPQDPESLQQQLDEEEELDKRPTPRVPSSRTVDVQVQLAPSMRAPAPRRWLKLAGVTSAASCIPATLAACPFAALTVGLVAWGCLLGGTSCIAPTLFWSLAAVSTITGAMVAGLVYIAGRSVTPWLVGLPQDPPLIPERYRWWTAAAFHAVDGSAHLVLSLMAIPGAALMALAGLGVLNATVLLYPSSAGYANGEALFLNGEATVVGGPRSRMAYLAFCNALVCPGPFFVASYLGCLAGGALVLQWLAPTATLALLERLGSRPADSVDEQGANP